MNIGDLTSLSLDAPISLFQLTRWNTANLNEVFFFSNNYGVAFGGVSYNPLAVTIEGISFSGTGSLPQARLKIADPMGILTTLVRNNRVSGATIAYYQTRLKYLDGQPGSNTSKVLPPQIFDVSHPEQFKPNREIVFVLEPRIYRLREEHGRRVSASCQAVYKDGITCPYTGSLPTCNKRVTGSNGCEGHFPGQQIPALAAGFFAENIIR